MDADGSKIKEQIAQGGAQIADALQAMAHKGEVKERVQAVVEGNSDQLQRAAGKLQDTAGGLGERARRAIPDQVQEVAEDRRGRLPWILAATLGLVAVVVVVRRALR